VVAREICHVLTLFNLTTKVALTLMAPRMLEALASIATELTPLAMGLGNVFGKTHDHRKVRKCTDYHCSTSSGGIRVIVFIFFQRSHYGKDDQINGRERKDLVKSYSEGNE
jgi:hypothetical protein